MAVVPLSKKYCARAMRMGLSVSSWVVQVLEEMLDSTEELVGEETMALLVKSLIVLGGQTLQISEVVEEVISQHLRASCQHAALLAKSSSHTL